MCDLHCEQNKKVVVGFPKVSMIELKLQIVNAFVYNYKKQKDKHIFGQC